MFKAFFTFSVYDFLINDRDRDTHTQTERERKKMIGRLRKAAGKLGCPG